jgi:hypothetical protein
VVGGWVGSCNTRERSYGSGPDCHVAHMTRVNRWLIDVELKPTWHATWQKLTCGITWLVHVAPTATCQILLKNATSRLFWKKVPSLLRTTIRTRMRICHKNIHPSFQNFKLEHFQNFKIKINARKMNHKILEQIKEGGFLAGDLPMSTSSSTYVNLWIPIYEPKEKFTCIHICTFAHFIEFDKLKFDKLKIR